MDSDRLAVHSSKRAQSLTRWCKICSSLTSRVKSTKPITNMIKLAKIPNLTELTYRSIKQNLLDGTLGELSRLTEESLATQLGVSKSPVREALNRLEAEGLIYIESRRGAFVREFSPKELRDLFEVREMLEVYAVAIAKVTPALLVELAASIERVTLYVE